MAGHISYPRTAEAESAWDDYRDAVILANAGSRAASIALLQSVYDNPNAPPDLKQLAAEHLTKLHMELIAEAMSSPIAGTYLEGYAAQQIVAAGFYILAFNLEVGLNGETGEIDIKTPFAIIEVTITKKGKLSQIKTLMTDRDLNPDGKPVILYAPNYGMMAGSDITDEGALLARTTDELIALLQSQKDR